jgi:hypothetical protein
MKGRGGGREEKRGVGTTLLHGEEKGCHRGSCTGGEHGPVLLVSFPCPCKCPSIVFVRMKGKRRERK